MSQDPLTGETHLRHHMTPDGFFKGRQIVTTGSED
ncbi:MAG: 50S ribosomal protein L32 [Methylobacter sp.]